VPFSKISKKNGFHRARASFEVSAKIVVILHLIENHECSSKLGVAHLKQWHLKVIKK
jgi:hypothetical protein